MDIQSTLLSATLPNRAVSENLSQWMLGQVLSATVTGRKSADTLLLQINKQTIETKTISNKPIYIGAQLKLVVEQQEPSTVLRVLQQQSPKLVHESKQQLLRENIPKQASMEKLTSILNQSTKNPGGIVKGATTPIEQQIKKLIERLPTQINLKNESGLKSAINNSGIFLESKLLSEVTKNQNKTKQVQPISQSNSPDISKDLKTNLLQLSDLITKYKQGIQKPFAQLIKPTQVIPLFEGAKSLKTMTKNILNNPTAFIDIDNKIDIEAVRKQIESSIARIEVNQSKAVVTHDNQFPAWSIELPIKDKQDIDLLKLDIHHDIESKAENDEEKTWTVNLKINLKDKGTLSARITMLDKEVSASVWSEDYDLNNLIDNNLSLLSKRIEKCGLTMGKIVCLSGAPTCQDENMIADNLINISV